MSSKRLEWDLRPNRISALLEAKRRGGAAILDLTESNPTRADLDYPAQDILASFANPQSLLYEPAAAGLQAAREAVSDYYSARGERVSPDRVLLTASTSEGYAFLFKLLCDPGDELLTPRPSYPLFEFLARLEGVRVVQYPLAYHGRWEIDFDGLDRALTSRTRAIVLVNPNNPTGSFLKRRELPRLIETARACNLAIISDEVFSDYCFETPPDGVRTLTAVDSVLVFSMSGLSKIAGLPQVKLGWIVTGGPSDEARRLRERLELIADTYLSVASPVQHAARRLLAAGEQVQRRIQARVRRNLQALGDALRGSVLDVLDVEGGWYAILRVPRTRTEEEWTLDLLDRDGVLVQPGFFYDFESEAFLVVSLLTPESVFDDGIARLRARIETGVT